MMRTTTMRNTITPLLLALGSAACGDDLPNPPGVVDDAGGQSSGSSSTTGSSTDSTSSSSSAAPASSDEGGATTTGTTGHSSVGIPDECTVTADCVDGELCVAPFDQMAGPEGKGPLECVSDCVVIMDEDRWCADAAACCDPDAECTDRGYCVYPEDTGTGSGGTAGGSTGGTMG
jgi:hypothetical protein